MHTTHFDLNDEVSAEVVFDWTEEEPQTRDYPGASSSASINTVRLWGKDDRNRPFSVDLTEFFNDNLPELLEKWESEIEQNKHTQKVHS